METRTSRILKAAMLVLDETNNTDYLLDTASREIVSQQYITLNSEPTPGQEHVSENIEIVDEYGNIINNFSDMPIVLENELKDQDILMGIHTGEAQKTQRYLTEVLEIQEDIRETKDIHEDRNEAQEVPGDTYEVPKLQKYSDVVHEGTENDTFLEDNETMKENTELNEPAAAQKPRKRKRNPNEWKVNVRKRKCQSGEEYVNVRGKTVMARSVTNMKNCLENCKFKCAVQISSEERQQAFKSYWSLTQNEKYLFLKSVTKKVTKGRKTTAGDSRRSYTFLYFLEIKGETIRVCKDFFLGTLNISQKPVYTAHLQTNEVKRDNRGKQSSKKLFARKEEVMSHIKKFPVIDSHYCRHTTKRKYLEANLSVAKMYHEYVKWCEGSDTDPVKLSYYRYIFTTEFNYGFLIPKKDRCLKCESYKLKKQDKLLTAEDQISYEEHTQIKNEMRNERNMDRETKVPTLSFDLENVITCPRTEVGDFFYNQKLNIYNLTGHFSTTRRAYCAIWTEARQGRSGNIIASAFRKILEEVLNDNNITELVTWSDSCVPQNRNSHISFAVLDALTAHPELKSVTMKYSVPGHGAIQEVDNIHSNIERYMSKTEFHSPLSFIRNLKAVNKKKPYCILQMKDQDFRDFESCAKQLPYNKIPFSRVASLRFTQSLQDVEYKLRHGEDFKRETLRHVIPKALRCRNTNKPENNLPCQSLIMSLKPKVLPVRNSLPPEKVKAIKKMIKDCMPNLDKEYFSSLLNSLS